MTTNPLPLRLSALVVACALFGGVSLAAQVPDSIRTGVTTEGKEFWVVFQKNFRDYTENQSTRALEPAEPLFLELFITSSKAVRGYVEIEGIGFRRDFSLPAGEVISIKIDSAAQLTSSEEIEKLGVHIVADQAVAVYGLSHRHQTTDTYLAYPIDVLGTTYRAIGYKWLAKDLMSQMAVIATEDDTHVKITPSTRTLGGRPANQPFTVTLNKGEAYQVIPYFDVNKASDLTGSLIESDKPVAVFSGHNCAYVPDVAYKACNILVEQIPPVQSWGRQFYVGTLAGRSASVIRVMAAEDGTEVFENNSMVAQLDAGEFYENPNLNRNTMLTANHPILVAQFSKGFTVPDPTTGRADSVGDPMMIMVAPTEQFLSSYRFATPVKGSWQHYINIVAPTESLGSLRLNGEAINPARFQKFGISRYSVAQLLIPYGTYSITGNKPFGLYSYGFGYADKIYDAYGNGGGQSMIQIVKAPDIVPPSLEATPDMTIRAINGIIRDDRLNDLGIEEVRVVEFDNLTIDIPEFERGAPQATARIRTITEGQNAYARLELVDRAGNTATKMLCVQYDEFGDTLMVTVSEGDEPCAFAPPIYIGGYFRYSVIDNNVTIPAASELIDNPVLLKGAHGQPAYGVGAYASLPYDAKWHLTGRIGLDFWSGDAYGYWPDSAAPRADDGTPVVEEFQLHRNTTYLTLSPGVRYFPLNMRSYVFGTLNIGLPLGINDRYTRTILSPSEYVYENGRNRQVEYEGDGPTGFSIVMVPEIGIGADLPIDKSFTIFGELGAGFTLNSISPERGWRNSWLFGRIGATKVFRF